MFFFFFAFCLGCWFLWCITFTCGFWLIFTCNEILSKNGVFDTIEKYGYGYGFSHTQLEPRAKEWMLKSAQCDYHALNKLAQENPALVRRRDMNVR